MKSTVHRICALLPAAAALCLLASPLPAGAQLRPLPPPEWELLDEGRVSVGRVGGALLMDQRASLAGTQGRLLELGDFSLSVRTGRTVIEVAGTALRLFDDEETFTSPFGGARESNGERRRDVGDFRVSTLLLLTDPERPAAAVLRFGTRLPTTDNEVGLERDRTDFFALLGGRFDGGDYLLGAEAGVGINGTHDPVLDQSDVLMYSASAAYTRWLVSPRMALVGHFDGMSGLNVRGNEELAELRVGARVGRRWWAEAEVVYGLQPFSPRTGLLVHAGFGR